MRIRDGEDWPILAAALALDCPIWTEHIDFFGCGVATWTTDRIEFYLDEEAWGRSQDPQYSRVRNYSITFRFRIKSASASRTVPAVPGNCNPVVRRFSFVS